jgi:biopolymer transport protein ExbD
LADGWSARDHLGCSVIVAAPLSWRTPCAAHSGGVGNPIAVQSFAHPLQTETLRARGSPLRFANNVALLVEEQSHLVGSRSALDGNAGINVTPFVGVMLALLLFFMLSLPHATTSLQIGVSPAFCDGSCPGPPYVSVGQDGRLSLVANGAPRPTNMATLRSDLARFKSSSDVLVRADRGVRYAAFFDVVNALQSDGYNVGLITEDVGP